MNTTDEAYHDYDEGVIVIVRKFVECDSYIYDSVFVISLYRLNNLTKRPP